MCTGLIHTHRPKCESTPACTWKKKTDAIASLSFLSFSFFFYLFIFRTNVNLNVYSRSQVCRDSEATVLSEKRKEVACMFKKRKEKKSFGLFRFEFFVFHSRRPLNRVWPLSWSVWETKEQDSHVSLQTAPRQPKIATQQHIAEKIVSSHSLDSHDNHSQKGAQLTTIASRFVFRCRLMDTWDRRRRCHVIIWLILDKKINKK